MKTYFFLVLMLLVSAANAETKIFIIDGQSNSSGRGELSQVPSYPNAERIYLFDNAGTWRLATEPTDSPVGEVQSVTRDIDAGAGYAMAFANRLADLYPDDTIGIVQCSKGSSPVKTFRRFWTSTARHGVCMARARAAMVHGRIAGLVWWQFESDTTTSTDAAAWRETVSQVWAAIREDLNIPELPIVFARANLIGKDSRHPYWLQLRGFQAEISMHKVAMVDTHGITWQADKIHATTAGYQVQGVRFADAMYDLLNN